MKIQSLSIVVPNKKCVNNCAFCVSKMHCNAYRNQIDDNLPFFHLYTADYIKRLEFARHNGCNTVMLTGCSEPQQNRTFLTYFGMFMKMMRDPFQWIEMQTTGTLIDENYLRFLREHVGVSLISLSVSSFDDDENNAIIGTSPNGRIDLKDLCAKIKKYDFGLRLSLNMTKCFRKMTPRTLLKYCKETLGADQVTLRVLYSSGKDTPQDKWIAENAMPMADVNEIERIVMTDGEKLGVLPHGATKYSVNGLCVVIDRDCMDKTEKNDENYKYLILQPNCRLYSSWDDPASMMY